jgi:hypothetical protein
MKDKLIERLCDIWDALTCGIRRFCLCPSPGTRLVTVLVLTVVLGGINIWFITNSIYNMGKRDAERKFLELQHIEPVELPLSEDSIHSGKNFNWKKIKN